MKKWTGILVPVLILFVFFAGFGLSGSQSVFTVSASRVYADPIEQIPSQGSIDPDKAPDSNNDGIWKYFVLGGIVLVLAGVLTLVIIKKKKGRSAKIEFEEADDFYTLPLDGSESEAAVFVHGDTSVFSDPAGSEAAYALRQFKPVVRSLNFQSGSQKLTIPAGGLLIGRDSECRMRFPDQSRGISRRHCRISFDWSTEMFVLEDLGSTYGTFMRDGTKLQPNERYTLRSGSAFYLGRRDNILSVELEKNYDFG